MFEENRSTSLFSDEMDEMISFWFGNKEQYYSTDSILGATSFIFNQNISNIPDDEINTDRIYFISDNIEEKETSRFKREDNTRTKFGSDFFNKYIKHKFETFFNMTNLRLRFESFPKYFYTEATHKRSQHYLDKTLEEFITNKDLYKDDNISQIKFNNNLKVINTLKEVKCKNKLNEINFDNFLKKNIEI